MNENAGLMNIVLVYQINKNYVPIEPLTWNFNWKYFLS
jgi:hypothetical protein